MPEIPASDVDPAVLDAARERLGYTVPQVARRLHVHQRTWSRWLQDRRVPTNLLPALARVLELPELLAAFDSPEPIKPRGASKLEKRVELLERMLAQLGQQVSPGNSPAPDEPRPAPPAKRESRP